MPSPKIWELAERLIACEAAGDPPFGSNVPTEFWVVDKLRGPLTSLVGIWSFRALLVRALALTKARVPGLNGVQVGADGSLEGFTNADMRPPDTGGMLVAQLLGLLAVLVGEDIICSLLLVISVDFPGFVLDPKEKDPAEGFM